MSVHKDERSDSKLSLFVASRELACYTIQICKNPKVFLPEYSVVTQEIVNLAMRIHGDLWTANNIVVRSKEDLTERSQLQERACRYCNQLLADIDIAHKLFHLSAKRVEFWTTKIVSVRNTTRNWKKSDADRYKQYR